MLNGAREEPPGGRAVDRQIRLIETWIAEGRPRRARNALEAARVDDVRDAPAPRMQGFGVNHYESVGQTWEEFLCDGHPTRMPLVDDQVEETRRALLVEVLDLAPGTSGVEDVQHPKNALV